MKLKLSVVMPVAFFMVCLSVNSQTKYKSIFNGASLDGWHIVTKPSNDKYYATKENFFVKNGALNCFQLPNKKGGVIISDGIYQDFELILDVRSEWGCDSGIFLRCTEDGRGIQILNDYLENGNVGFPFGQGTGGYISRPIRLHKEEGNVKAKDYYDGKTVDNLVYSIDAKGWKKTWKLNDWNTIKIRCIGKEPKITTWINGVKIMEMNGATYKGRALKDDNVQNLTAKPIWNSEKVHEITGGKGAIGFQIHPGGRWKSGSSVLYRNIKIKELKVTK